MTFNRNFDSFRDKRLVVCTPENVRNLRFKSPLGNFDLTKQGNDWMHAGVKADSATVANYVNQLRNISASKIDDTFSVPETSDYNWVISGDNMEEIKIDGYAVNGLFKLQSSLNPNVIFESDSSGVFSKLMKYEMDFMVGE